MVARASPRAPKDSNPAERWRDLVAATQSVYLGLPHMIRIVSIPSPHKPGAVNGAGASCWLPALRGQRFTDSLVGA